MILCSCNVLTSADLRETAERLQDSDPTRPVTPLRLFRELGVRPKCGSCLGLLRRTLQDWGFPATCPEPLATIAEDNGDGGSDVSTGDWVTTPLNEWDPV